MEMFIFVYIYMKFSCRPFMGGNLEQNDSLWGKSTIHIAKADPVLAHWVRVPLFEIF